MRKESTTHQAGVRRPNAGSFKPGHDPRRHTFTAAERSRGFWTAIAIFGVSIGDKLHTSGRWPNFRARRGGN